jgi:probable HAF family extracellular repeat protein
MADLGIPQGCGSSCANAINASGQVVGYGATPSGVYRGFLYSNGQITFLNNSSSVAYDINDLGQVVGTAGGHAFLYSGGTMTDLGVLPGASNSRAAGINSSGQIVGASLVSGVGDRAFLYSNGTMSRLNDLIGPNPKWNIFAANDINDKGWIVGSGVAANGEQHAILLTPVPEPSTLALLGIGIICLPSLFGFARRRRKHGI